MEIRVARDDRCDVTTVDLVGSLTAGSGARVLSFLVTVAAAQPGAVVVDLSEVDLAADACPEIFASALHIAKRGFGVPILLLGADAVMEQRLNEVHLVPLPYPRSEVIWSLSSAARTPRRPGSFSDKLSGTLVQICPN